MSYSFQNFLDSIDITAETTEGTGLAAIKVSFERFHFDFLLSVKFVLANSIGTTQFLDAAVPRNFTDSKFLLLTDRW